MSFGGSSSGSTHDEAARAAVDVQGPVWPSRGWCGTDIFHFDERGKIVGKFTYAHYGRRPHVRRDLGV